MHSMGVRNDIAKLRSDRGISQGELGLEIGVSRQTVNSIENGRYNPSLPLAFAIAKYFDRPIEEIFHDDD